ncbi:hypothetical protein O7623_18825 [Solwaraspora sp. WMMD791]|uniref:hypothetical protein n=1 Tax=Solwaraspora sp. WMMD791 TaxID=3016086 RepID=UPI00249C67B5|nr:hypothetical protein [Solwaraspora sp. WMMD791]WFE25440.1 hypothetical protein O7623_18825 [Solwaraspora sp. WMMD791]
MPIFPTEIDDQQIQSLGNAFVALGNDLFRRASGITGPLGEIAWRGTGRDRAVQAWGGIVTNTVVPVANEMIAVGQAIQDFAQAVREARAEQEQMRTIEIIVGVIGVVLTPLTFAVGPLFAAITRAVSVLLSSLVRVVVQVSVNFGRALRVVAAGMPRITALQFGDGLAAALHVAARNGVTLVAPAARTPAQVAGAAVRSSQVVIRPTAEIVSNVGTNMAVDLAPEAIVKTAYGVKYEADPVVVGISAVMGLSGAVPGLHDMVPAGSRPGPVGGLPGPVGPPLPVPATSVPNAPPIGSVTSSRPPGIDLSLTNGGGPPPKLVIEPPTGRPVGEPSAVRPVGEPHAGSLPPANLGTAPKTAVSSVPTGIEASARPSPVATTGEAASPVRPGQPDQRSSSTQPTNPSPQPRPTPEPGRTASSVVAGQVAPDGSPRTSVSSLDRTTSVSSSATSARSSVIGDPPGQQPGQPQPQSQPQSQPQAQSPDSQPVATQPQPQPDPAPAALPDADASSSAPTTPPQSPQPQPPRQPVLTPEARHALDSEYGQLLDRAELLSPHPDQYAPDGRGWAERADGPKVLGIFQDGWLGLNKVLAESRLNPFENHRANIEQRLHELDLDSADLAAFQKGLERGVRPSELLKLNAQRRDGLGIAEPLTQEEAKLALHPDPRERQAAQLISRRPDQPFPDLDWWRHQELPGHVRARLGEGSDHITTVGHLLDGGDNPYPTPGRLWEATNGQMPPGVLEGTEGIRQIQVELFNQAYVDWRFGTPKSTLSPEGLATVNARWEQAVRAAYREAFETSPDGPQVTPLERLLEAMETSRTKLYDAFTAEAMFERTLDRARSTFDEVAAHFPELDSVALERAWTVFRQDFRTVFERSLPTNPRPEDVTTAPYRDLLDADGLFDRFIGELKSNRAVAEARDGFQELAYHRELSRDVLDRIGSDYREDFVYLVREPLVSGGHSKLWLNHEQSNGDVFSSYVTKADDAAQAPDTTAAPAGPPAVPTIRPVETDSRTVETVTQTAQSLQQTRLADPQPLDCLPQLQNLDDALTRVGVLKPRPKAVQDSGYLEAGPAQRFAMEQGQPWRQAGTIEQVAGLLDGSPGSVAYLTAGPPNAPTHAFALVNAGSSGLIWVDVTVPADQQPVTRYDSRTPSRGAPVGLVDLRFIAFGPDRVPLTGSDSAHHDGVSGLLLAPHDYRPGTLEQTTETTGTTRTTEADRADQGVEALRHRLQSLTAERDGLAGPSSGPIAEQIEAHRRVLTDQIDLIDRQLQAHVNDALPTAPTVIDQPAHVDQGQAEQVAQADHVAQADQVEQERWAPDWNTVSDGLAVSVAKVFEFDGSFDKAPTWTLQLLDVVFHGLRANAPVPPTAVIFAAVDRESGEVVEAGRDEPRQLHEIIGQEAPGKGADLVVLLVNNPGTLDPAILATLPEGTRLVQLSDAFSEGLRSVDRRHWPELVQRYVDFAGERRGITFGPPAHAQQFDALGDGQFDSGLRDLGDFAAQVVRFTSLSPSVARQLAADLTDDHYLRNLANSGDVVSSGGNMYEVRLKLGPSVAKPGYKAGEVNFAVPYGARAAPKSATAASQTASASTPAIGLPPESGVVAAVTATAAVTTSTGQSVTTMAEYATSIKSFKTPGYFDYPEPRITVRRIGSAEAARSVLIGKQLTVRYLKETLVPDLSGLRAPDGEQDQLSPGTVTGDLDGAWKKVVSVDLGVIRSKLLDHYHSDTTDADGVVHRRRARPEVLRSIAEFLSERTLTHHPRDLASGALLLSVPHTLDGRSRTDQLTLTLTPQDTSSSPHTWAIDRMSNTILRLDSLGGTKAAGKDGNGSSAQLAASVGSGFGINEMTDPQTGDVETPGRGVVRGVLGGATAKAINVSDASQHAQKAVVERTTDALLMNRSLTATVVVTPEVGARWRFTGPARTFLAAARDEAGSTSALTPLTFLTPAQTGVQQPFTVLPMVTGIAKVEQVFPAVLASIREALEGFIKGNAVSPVEIAAMERHFAAHFSGSALLTGHGKAVDGGLQASYELGTYLVHVEFWVDQKGNVTDQSLFGVAGSARSDDKLTIDSSAKYGGKLVTRTGVTTSQQIGVDGTVIGRKKFGPVLDWRVQGGFNVGTDLTFSQANSDSAMVGYRGNRRIKLTGAGVRGRYAVRLRVETLVLDLTGTEDPQLTETSIESTVTTIGRLDSDRVDALPQLGVLDLADPGPEVKLPPGSTPLTPPKTAAVAGAIAELLGYPDEIDITQIDKDTVTTGVRVVNLYGPANALSPSGTTYLGLFTAADGTSWYLTVHRRLYRARPVDILRDPVKALTDVDLRRGSQFSGGPENVKDVNSSLDTSTAYKIKWPWRLLATLGLRGERDGTAIGLTGTYGGQVAFTLWDHTSGHGISGVNRRSAKDSTASDLYQFHTVLEVRATRKGVDDTMVTETRLVPAGSMTAVLLRTETLRFPDRYNLPAPALTGTVTEALAGQFVSTSETTTSETTTSETTVGQARRYLPPTVASGQSLGLGDVVELSNADDVMPTVLTLLPHVTGTSQAWSVVARRQDKLAMLLEADALHVLAPYLGANGALQLLLPRKTWYGWTVDVVTVTARMGQGTHIGSLPAKEKSDTYHQGGVQSDDRRGRGFEWSRGGGLSVPGSGEALGVAVRLFGRSVGRNRVRTVAVSKSDRQQERLKIDDKANKADTDSRKYVGFEEYTHPWTFTIRVATVSSPPEMVVWMSLGQAGPITTWWARQRPQPAQTRTLPGTLRLHYPTALTTDIPMLPVGSAVTQVVVYRDRRPADLLPYYDLSARRLGAIGGKVRSKVLLNDLTVDRSMLAAAVRGVQNTVFRHTDRLPHPPYWLAPGTQGHLATQVVPAVLLGLGDRILQPGGVRIPGLSHLLIAEPTVQLLPHTLTYLYSVKLTNESVRELGDETETGTTVTNSRDQEFLQTKLASSTERPDPLTVSSTVEHTHEDKTEGYVYLVSSGTFRITGTHTVHQPITIDLTVSNAAVITVTAAAAKALKLPEAVPLVGPPTHPRTTALHDGEILVVESTRATDLTPLDPQTLPHHPGVTTVVVDIDSTGTVHLGGQQIDDPQAVAAQIQHTVGWSRQDILLLPKHPAELSGTSGAAHLRKLARYLHRSLSVQVVVPTRAGFDAPGRIWRWYREDRGAWFKADGVAHMQELLGGPSPPPPHVEIVEAVPGTVPEPVATTAAEAVTGTVPDGVSGTVPEVAEQLPDPASSAAQAFLDSPRSVTLAPRDTTASMVPPEPTAHLAESVRRDLADRAALAGLDASVASTAITRTAVLAEQMFGDLDQVETRRLWTMVKLVAAPLRAGNDPQRITEDSLTTAVRQLLNLDDGRPIEDGHWTLIDELVRC